MKDNTCYRPAHSCSNCQHFRLDEYKEKEICYLGAKGEPRYPEDEKGYFKELKKNEDDTEKIIINYNRNCIIYGDYVLTPCKNAFNEKISYWLSKKGCTIAIYAFTPIDGIELTKAEIKKCIKSAIPFLESKINEIV